MISLPTIGKVIVKVWDDGCPFCVEYAPVFDKAKAEYPDITFMDLKIPRNAPSEFRAKYMQVDGKEKNSVPATLIFQDGELVAQGWGRMHEPQLKEFIETGKQAEAKIPDPIEWAKTATIKNLEESIFESDKSIARLQSDLRKSYIVKGIFEAEWSNRFKATLG